MLQNHDQKIGTILLAAGSSSRMGKSKQWLLVEREPLLLRSAKAALAAGAGKVFVVLGANEKSHRDIIKELPVELVHNENWQKGMGNSLKAGLNHVLKMAPETEAVIIMVCDQPRITGDHLKNLIQKYTETRSKIVASTYSGAVGVPALFDKSLFPELFDVEDGMGAKKVLINHQVSIVTIDFKGGEIDLDTPGDYKNFIQESTADSND